MLNVLKARLQQGYQTGKFPPAPPNLPDRFLGRPSIDMAKCRADCDLCQQVCPTKAIVPADDAKGGKKALSIDMGRCLFCGDRVAACPTKAITFNLTDFHLSPSAGKDCLTHSSAASHRRNCKISADFRHPASLCGAARPANLTSPSSTPWRGLVPLWYLCHRVTASCRLPAGNWPGTRNMLIGLQKHTMPCRAPMGLLGACAISGGIYQTAANASADWKTSSSQTHPRVPAASSHHPPGHPPSDGQTHTRDAATQSKIDDPGGDANPAFQAECQVGFGKHQHEEIIMRCSLFLALLLVLTVAHATTSVKRFIGHSCTCQGQHPGPGGNQEAPENSRWKASASASMPRTPRASRSACAPR